MDEKQEDVGEGWLRVTRTHTAEEYSTGWKGVKDAFGAWISGQDRQKYQNQYTFSVYIKPEQNVFTHSASVTKSQESKDD